MKIQMMVVAVTLAATAASADPLKSSLTDYKALPGLTATAADEEEIKLEAARTQHGGALTGRNPEFRNGAQTGDRCDRLRQFTANLAL